VDLKREYSGLVVGSDSRSGTDASTEMVRLVTSGRVWPVVDVPLLGVELLASFLGLERRFKARRRANGTRTRTRATTKRKPPTEATTMIAVVLLLDEVDCAAVG